MACLGLALSGCGKAPGNAELRQGIRLLDEGKPELAVGLFAQAVEILATNQVASAQALNYLGLALHQSGRLREAADTYTGALNRDLNLFAARFNRGCLRLEQGDFAEALRDLTTYVTHQPKAAEGWLQLGVARWHARQIEGAADAFRQAAQLASSRTLQARALNGAGLCSAQQGQPDEALRFFAAAAQLDPQLTAPVLNQAVVLETARNDRLRALEMYQAYLELSPDGAGDQRVHDHVRRLAMALRPTLPSEQELVAQGASNLARITNLFSRVGSIGSGSTTGVSPEVTLTGSPPAMAAISTQLAGATPTAVAATTTTSAAPVLVVTGAPPATATGLLASATSTVPAPPSTNQTGVPPVLAGATSSPPSLTVAASTEAVEPAAEQGTSTLAPGNEVASTGAAAPATFEEVQIEAPPVLMAAAPRVQPLEGASPVVPEVAQSDVQEESTLTEEQPESETPDEGSSGEPEGEEGGRSFLSRINPLNLFRRGPQEKRVTPLPPKADGAPVLRTAPASVPELVPAPGASPAAPAETTADPGRPPTSPEPVVTADSASPQPARPAFRRYRYQSPPKPEPGDAALARRHFLRGVQSYQLGKLDAAAQAYAEAIEADPASLDAHYNLAALAYQRGQIELCLKESEIALAIEPGNAAARFNFALALQKAGYPLDAVVELEQVLAAQPGSAEAHLALGALYADTIGDPAQARQHYQRVLELQPGHPQAAALRRWLAVNRPPAN